MESPWWIFDKRSASSGDSKGARRSKETLWLWFFVRSWAGRSRRRGNGFDPLGKTSLWGKINSIDLKFVALIQFYRTRPWQELTPKIPSTVGSPWPWWRTQAGICPITTWPTILSGVEIWDAILHWDLAWNGWRRDRDGDWVFILFATKSNEILLRPNVRMIVPQSLCAISFNTTIYFLPTFR